jgi:phosphoserine phosphatase
MATDGIQLVVFDMEGTLTNDPTVWELMHLKVGTWESHGLPYWERFKAFEIGYDEFARLDVGAWKGAPVSWLDDAVLNVPLMPGCEELLTFLVERGVHVAIVSNGLERLGKRLARQFGFETVFANRETVSDGLLTGELDIVVSFDGKGAAMDRIMRELDVPAEAVMAVGDGPADLEMFRRAGVSVAFGPTHPDVAENASHIFTERDLTQLIPLFGNGE